nr:uncharacterized protein LOC117277897 [Nicotiana tomentosiformis]
MGRFVQVKTSDLIPTEQMPFPEEWNMNPVAWMPDVVPDLKSWVHALASTSVYVERSWRDRPMGGKKSWLGQRCGYEAPSGKEETSAPAPKPTRTIRENGPPLPRIQNPREGQLIGR